MKGKHPTFFGIADDKSTINRHAPHHWFYIVVGGLVTGKSKNNLPF